MENQVVDTESLSLEQLAELAIGQPSHPAYEQPRNADGTFAPVTPVVVEPVADATGTTEDDHDPNEVFRDGEWQYALTIPGEEGAGDETFYGRGPDFGTRYQAAVEQLRQSKIHLNRKLRQQSQQIKATEAAKVALTADERYILAQRMQTEPDLVLDEAIEKRLASDPRIKAAEELATQQKTLAVTTQWVAANPDYYAVEANGKRLWRELNANGVYGTPTIADIDKAYQSLKSDGLLQAKPADTVPATAAPVPARRSSGLPTRSTAVAVPATAPVIDPYKIPLEELMILANQQARK